MPSAAYRKFLHNTVDVNRLIKSHKKLSPTGNGKRALGHITRSGVVMLCAAWELYVEDVLIESVKYIAGETSKPLDLPKSVQKHLVLRIKENKNELKMLELGSIGWRNVYIAYCENEARSINTPKTTILEPIYEKYLGLPNLSSFWSIGGQFITDFVSVRGDIAHNGRSARYITRTELIQFNDTMKYTAREMDNQICEYIFNMVPATVQPWRKMK